MRRALTLLSLLALAMSWLGSANTARAATTWQLRAGAESPDKGIQVLAFLPETVSIGVGDTIRWTFDAAEFHTVTFLSGEEWPALMLPTATGVMFNPKVALPVGGTSYDGTGYVNSGFLMAGPDSSAATYQLTFTRPGMYPYVCVIHPKMLGTVEVRAGGAGSESQAQVTQRGEAQTQTLLAKARQQIAQSKVTASAGPNGSTVYTVDSGVGDGTVAVMLFLPSYLEIGTGDTVVWEIRDPYTPHTVTFNPALGPPAPQVGPDSPIEDQLSFPPIFVVPAGGPTFNGQGFVNSAIFGNPDDPASTSSYRLTFTAPGTFDYVCVLHVPMGMVGTVKVLPPGVKPALPPSARDPFGAIGDILSGSR